MISSFFAFLFSFCLLLFFQFFSSPFIFSICNCHAALLFFSFTLLFLPCYSYFFFLLLFMTFFFPFLFLTLYFFLSLPNLVVWSPIYFSLVSSFLLFSIFFLLLITPRKECLKDPFYKPWRRILESLYWQGQHLYLWKDILDLYIS